MKLLPAALTRLLHPHRPQTAATPVAPPADTADLLTGNQPPLLGLREDGTPLRLGPERGHTLVVGGSGMGASTLLRSLGAQFAHRGVRVDILDVAFEHPWAHQVDAVTCYQDSEAIHTYLFDLAARTGQSPAVLEPGPVRQVVLIESEPTAGELLRFRSHPGPGGVALDALVRVLAAGRIHGIQVVMVCHDVPAPVGHIRDLFSTHLLATLAPRAWHQAGAAPIPHTARHGQYLLGGRPFELLQVPYLSHPQAAELAAGPPAPDRPVSAPRSKETTR